MTLRMKLILMTTVVVTVLFGVAEWLSYQQTTALLEEHERILTETADHGVALQKLRATKERMFLSVTTVRVLHAVITLLVAVAALNSVWYSVVYRQREVARTHQLDGTGYGHSPIPVKRRDEIGELTAAFDQLRQRLTSHVDHINSATKLSAFALMGAASYAESLLSAVKLPQR